jgi:hypothetical protein
LTGDRYLDIHPCVSIVLHRTVTRRGGLVALAFQLYFTKKNTMATTSWIKSHPGKGVWTLMAILFNVLRFPLWLIYFLPPFTRQSSKWSFRKYYPGIKAMQLWHHRISFPQQR